MILKEERIKEIALIILEKHHAVLLDNSHGTAMSKLFKILQKEQAFDYHVLPEQKIEEFFSLIDHHLQGDNSNEIYLLEKAPLVWKAYLSKTSRTLEIKHELAQISKYTKISEKELCDFFRQAKKIPVI